MPVVGKENIYFEPEGKMIELIITFTKRKQFSIKTNPESIMFYLEKANEDFYTWGYHTYQKAVDEFKKNVISYTDLWKEKNRKKIIAIKYEDDASFEDGVIIIFDYVIRYQSGSHFYKRTKDMHNEGYLCFESSTLNKNEYMIIPHTEEKEKFLKAFNTKLLELQNKFKKAFKNPGEFERLINKNQKLIEG